ncbi:UV radiation resistance associated protein [Golovinomyces cichoracearum]|uniref:Autophagy-related protein 14 n=1 Tax=Golovinomyces cichoracearum TaxID=62708 RepID=A0A420ID57_9PEZI|nr:UV radiation resistance associated protein [Golovinomyces cichoracearum]
MVNEAPRPLLLPQNRKIRHLRGIYLRNLNLNLSRPAGHTTDDVVGKTFSSALPSAQIHESSLQDSFTSQVPSPSELSREDSSLALVPPFLNQQNLEEVIDWNVADTFITLHCASQTGPIYISEVVQKSINPIFRQFDLSIFGPTTTRLDTFVVKVWIKRSGDFELFIEQEVNLKSLSYIGVLTNRQFPSNSIIFDLVDGIYAMDLVCEVQKLKSGITLPTSSYSALLRLSNLDQSIQDALNMREELATQVNGFLLDGHVAEVSQAQERVFLANRYLTSQRRILKLSIRRRNELRASIEARKNKMKVGKELQGKTIADIENAQYKLNNCRKMLTTTVGEICGQRRRICEELQLIYPIDPVAYKPLIFTICGLKLPNSVFDDADEEIISAALGYVAQVVDMLQYYLSVPLPYPISPYGSRAVIKDFISFLHDKQRTFPLCMKGTVRFRFEYGVFLLNKNIEWLAKSQGLKIIDIRQTLPNLKYLLYICCAASSELPDRKAGGIKGLIFRSGREALGRYDSRNKSKS